MELCDFSGFPGYGANLSHLCRFMIDFIFLLRGRFVVTRKRQKKKKIRDESAALRHHTGRTMNVPDCELCTLLPPVTPIYMGGWHTGLTLSQRGT